MPNARTHDLITIVTGAAGAPAALNSGLPDMNPTSGTFGKITTKGSERNLQLSLRYFF